MSRSDKIPKTLFSSLACFSDYLQMLVKSSCGTRRLEKNTKAVVEKTWISKTLVLREVLCLAHY